MKTIDFEKRMTKLEQRAAKLGYASVVAGTCISRCLLDRSMALSLNIKIPRGEQAVPCWSLAVGGLMQVKFCISYDLTIEGCLRRAEKHLDEAAAMAATRRRSKARAARRSS